MTQLQEDFLDELKSKEKLTVPEYAKLYAKHCQIAIEDEKSKGADGHKAKVMSEYYMLAVLSRFVNNDALVERVIALTESTPRVI